MDNETDAPTQEAINAAIRKPKKSKPAKKAAKKPAAKKAAKKPAAKKVAYAGKPKSAKKAKKAKTKAVLKKKPAKKAAKPVKSAACVRSERLDMRLTKAEKTKVHARAKKLRRTVTSIVIEAIEKIK